MPLLALLGLLPVARLALLPATLWPLLAGPLLVLLPAARVRVVLLWVVSRGNQEELEQGVLRRAREGLVRRLVARVLALAQHLEGQRLPTLSVMQREADGQRDEAVLLTLRRGPLRVHDGGDEHEGAVRHPRANSRDDVRLRGVVVFVEVVTPGFRDVAD